MTQHALPGLADRPTPVKANATPRATTCPDCGADTIAAWRDGLFETVTVDPVALTPLGELTAIATGRRTFEHWRDGLDQRRPDTIARWPAGADPTYPIRPEHRCGSPPPDHEPPPPPPTATDTPPY